MPAAPPFTSEADATDVTLAILFVDLDRFKLVNNQYGHLNGDAMLHEAALRLKASTRPTDLVARHGGDEFVVLMGGLPLDRRPTRPARGQHQFQRLPS